MDAAINYITMHENEEGKKSKPFHSFRGEKNVVERKSSKDALVRRVIKKSQVLFLHGLFNTVLHLK